MRAGPGYRPDIDGLRALAVGGVVLFHAFPGALPGGFAGVDVFFVISGFLIGSIILNGVASGTFSFLAFYHRRIVRLLPAFVLVCAATLGVGALMLVPSEFSTLTFTLRAAVLYGSNIVFALRTGYFDQAGASAPLLHTWSLAVEEQFYLLAPVLIWAIHRRRPAALGPALLALALVSFALGVHGAYAYPAQAFFLPHGRFWEVLLGVLIAYYAPLRRASPRLRLYAGMLGLAAILAAFALHSGENSRYPGLPALLPCLGAALLIEANRYESTLPGHWLSLAPLRYLGEISYPLYLWHWPLLVFMRLLGPEWSGPGPAAAAVVICVVLADLTRRFVEHPVWFGSRPGLRASYGALLASSVVFIGISLVSEATKGLPQRFSPEIRAILDAGQEWRSSTRLACMRFGTDPASPARFDAGHPCRIGARDKAPDLVLWGDSHAAAFQPSLDILLQQWDRGGIVISGVCKPVAPTTEDGPTRRACAAGGENALQDFIAGPARVLVIAQRWTSLIDGAMPIEREFRRVSLPELARREGELRTVLNGLVRRIEAAGKRVVILETVPEIEFNVANVLGFRRNLGLADPAEPTLASVLARQKPARDAIRSAIAGTSAGIIDPVPFLCRDRCAIAQNGTPLYFDNNHLTITAEPMIRAALSASAGILR